MVSFSKIKPDYFLLSGSIFLPSFLLQTSLCIRFFQVTVIIIFFIISGKRFKPVPVVILFTGITAANVIRPAGAVIFHILRFPVTEDALYGGISRALLLIGLIYVSRLSVSSSIRLPGRIGRMLGSVLFYFEKITEWERGKIKIFKKGTSFFDTFTEYIDNILFLSDKFEERHGESMILEKYPDSRLFWFYMVPFLLLNYTLLILNFLKYL